MTACPSRKGAAMDGFSFAGIHSSVYGCHYHPDAKVRGSGMADYDIAE